MRVSAFGHAGAVRRFVGVEAYAAGLSEDRHNDAVLVAGEVAANVFLHAADAARVRTWTTDDTFVFDIDDTGDGIRDPFAGYTIAGPLEPGGRGRRSLGGWRTSSRSGRRPSAPSFAHFTLG